MSIDPEQFRTDFDRDDEYAREQYEAGLRIAREYDEVHISYRGVWSARSHDGLRTVQSYETLGLHRSTADLVRGFVDGGIPIIDHREVVPDLFDGVDPLVYGDFVGDDEIGVGVIIWLPFYCDTEDPKDATWFRGKVQVTVDAEHFTEDLFGGRRDDTYTTSGEFTMAYIAAKQVAEDWLIDNDVAYDPEDLASARPFRIDH